MGKVRVPFFKGKHEFGTNPVEKVETEASVALLLDIQLIEPVVIQNTKLDQGKDRDRFALGPEQPMTCGKRRRYKKKKK